MALAAQLRTLNMRISRQKKRSLTPVFRQPPAARAALASGCFDEVNQTIEGLLDIRLKAAPLNVVKPSLPDASLLSL